MFRDPQINFYVDDVEALVSFYVDLMGFKETFRTPQEGTPEHVEVQLGGLVLGFAAHTAALGTHGVKTGGEGLFAGVVVWADDVDRAYGELTAKGAVSLSAPHDFLEGRLREAWVADPAGNAIEIVTRGAAA